VCLYYKEGKTITQIAKELSKAPSTVGNLLHLAKKRKEQYDKKKLKEILELNKKLNTHRVE
jgi:IS30 family transposase